MNKLKQCKRLDKDIELQERMIISLEEQIIKRKATQKKIKGLINGDKKRLNRLLKKLDDADNIQFGIDCGYIDK